MPRHLIKLVLKADMSMLHVAIPVLDEMDWLPACFDSLAAQSHSDFEVWVCVNQPDDWWQHPLRRAVCERNQSCLGLLEAESRFRVHVLDRTSAGCGWTGKKQGVGQARRDVMDAIAAAALPDEIIVSMDADTTMGPHYLASVDAGFRQHRDALGMVAPYAHQLTGEAIRFALDRKVSKT